MPPHASPDPARRATPLAGPPLRDLAAEDLADLALDLARGHGPLDVLRVAADGVARLVPGATQVVVSTLGRDGVELSAATGSGAASLEAWQHAVGGGPAARAAEQPGTVVVVDDLGHDPRWTDLHTIARREGLLSVLSVAALLPMSLPTSLPVTARAVVVGCYGSGRGAFGAPDTVRVALLAVAHVSVAVHRAGRAEQHQQEPEQQPAAHPRPGGVRPEAPRGPR